VPDGQKNKETKQNKKKTFYIPRAIIVFAVRILKEESSILNQNKCIKFDIDPFQFVAVLFYFKVLKKTTKF
jgi:hypothetical protein